MPLQTETPTKLDRAAHALHPAQLLNAVEAAIKHLWDGNPPRSLNDGGEVRQPSQLSREETRDVVDLLLRTGQLLMENGTTTECALTALRQLGHGFGCFQLDLLVSMNAVIATSGAGIEFRTKLTHVRPFGSVNMSLITSVLALIEQLNTGNVDRFQYRHRLEEMETNSRPYSRWFTVLMVGIACAAFSKLFGGDQTVFIATLVASSFAMYLRHELSSRGMNPFFVVIATSCLASSVVAFGLEANPEIALAACVLLLVPGVPLINSFDDLIHGHLLNGLARGVWGALISLGIASGLCLAISISGVRELSMSFTSHLPLWEDAAWSGAAALGFVVLFSLPKQAMPSCFVLAATAHALRTVLMSSGYAGLGSIEIATFLAAATIGFVGPVLERWQRVPTTLCVVCAAIPMVPGTYAFGTMINLLDLAGILGHGDGDVSAILVAASVNGLKTALICGAISAGITLPKLLSTFGQASR